MALCRVVDTVAVDDYVVGVLVVVVHHAGTMCHLVNITVMIALIISIEGNLFSLFCCSYCIISVDGVFWSSVISNCISLLINFIVTWLPFHYLSYSVAVTQTCCCFLLYSTMLIM